MWSLYNKCGEYLKPLVFSNGKTQEDVVKEVIDSIKQGHKIIFIRGVCGTGKSAIALHLAKEIGKASIVVPIKSLQEQYTKDYSEEKYVLKNNKERLKISSILGRQNFKCRFLQEFQGEEKNLQDYYNNEKNTKLSDIFDGMNKLKIPNKKDTCDNNFLPCKIELKEKNLSIIKDYIKQNPQIKITDFDSIKDIKRMSIAPICPYWSPIVPEDFEIKKFSDARKLKYKGFDGRTFTFYQRKQGCGFYDQYEAYANADVIIFNSMKYKFESIMGRKPETKIEIIDECDEFLDSFSNKEQINLNYLLFSLNNLFPEDQKSQKIIDKLIDIINTLKLKYKIPNNEISEIKDTLVQELLNTILENTEFLDSIETDESNYIYHLDEVAKIFNYFLDETFFSVEKRDNDLIIHLVTTNLAKRFQELVEKNKVLVMMSGTLHSEQVLRDIFKIEKFKIINAEINPPGTINKTKTGLEINCAYKNFQQGRITRKQYLIAFSKTVSCAKKPILVHVNAFKDLPTETEKFEFNLENLPTQRELIQQQIDDPFGKRINEFKNKNIDILFSTKCNRGVDFPGDVCNSIILTKFPYPNVNSIFWRILKKTKPEHFMNFYMDKARRELLQKIYRGLRSKDDKVYLFSPDLRVH